MLIKDYYSQGRVEMKIKEEQVMNGFIYSESSNGLAIDILFDTYKRKYLVEIKTETTREDDCCFLGSAEFEDFKDALNHYNFTKGELLK